ncbi:K+-sensing histidine kinase KdpD [Virgibacillus natechei]|uniref:K+-sensing histidine kinase KdpD n=1 Tax=Virgibacillus natechei TaxID=1216297 RepID=A0ABS4IMT4_9BACI|nr:histidine kinase [Virgibacillus natechei]MBP1971304.1 K+-sensing histidine kinase KdpD [Virgibacillus natechei]UZD12960.1 histidine kinase [Virgibacillus natechei]
MKKIKGRMDESILVCVYYGPNGERLIRRGYKLANMLDCPLYILTVDRLPYDEFNEEKSAYVDHWKELAEELDAEEFLLRDNEKRSSIRAIKEVAHKHNITQVIIGEPPQNRWEEITKGSFVNALLRELTFIDVHIVSVDRTIKSSSEDAIYEKGVRGFLQESGDSYRIVFTRSMHNQYEGIFYKDIGTDFNNGIFKFIHEGKTCQVHITEDKVTQKIKQPPNLK